MIHTIKITKLQASIKKGNTEHTGTRQACLMASVLFCIVRLKLMQQDKETKRVHERLKTLLSLTDGQLYIQKIQRLN
jgi:hypothetical protein